MQRVERARALILSLAAFVLAVAGCADVSRMGDLGHKNIRPNRFTDDRAQEMNRSFGRQMNNNNLVPDMHGNTRLELSQFLAEKIASMPEINTAYVMLTDNNAYVAVTESAKSSRQAAGSGNADDDLAVGLKEKVANQVRSLVPGVKNVFVSANPDFYGRMREIADEVGQGRPIQGFVEEFNTMVARIFPTPDNTR
jgi:YhcN/YlaJ family sporulation lipoprotein